MTGGRYHLKRWIFYIHIFAKVVFNITAKTPVALLNGVPRPVMDSNSGKGSLFFLYPLLKIHYNIKHKSICYIRSNRQVVRATKKKSAQILAQVKNHLHLCGANIIKVLHHAKVLSNHKKEAYGCKSRDFSIYFDCVSGDLLSFINPKTF